MEKTLKNSGYSLTKPRQTVFAALQSGTPRTVSDVIDELSAVIDRSSVYRTISLFEGLGIIVRVSQGFKYKIELSDVFSPHHHHLTCIKCSKVVSFDEPPELDQLLSRIAIENGFSGTEHSLEITGTCPACRKLIP